MRIDQEVTALRGDVASQRRAQEHMEAARDNWLRNAEVTTIMEELGRYAAGQPLDRLPAMQEIVESVAAAGRFTGCWCDSMVAAMRGQVLGQVPFRYVCSNGYTSVRLLSVGGASISLLAYEERGDVADMTSACFVDRELHEIVIAGRAAGLTHQLTGDARKPKTQTHQWKPGDKIVTPDADHTRQITAVTGRLSILQLAREKSAAAPTREIALGDGAVLHLSSGDRHESQTEMALAVLSAMQREDALPAIERLTQCGSAHLRWQAVRHAIALEPLRGFAALCRIAATTDDELNAPACSLRDQLAATYPQLLEMRKEQELEPCPA